MREWFCWLSGEGSWTVVVSESPVGSDPLVLEGCANVDFDAASGSAVVTRADGSCEWYPRIVRWTAERGVGKSSSGAGLETESVRATVHA